MAAPTILNSGVTDSGSGNVTALAHDISGWSLGVGDKLVVFLGTDSTRATGATLTQSGFTSEIAENGGRSRCSGQIWSKTLVSGDTSWTEIEATWSAAEKAAIHVYHFASGDHNGVDASGFGAYDLDANPDVPAITYGTNTKSLVFVVIKGAPTLTVNPTGYTTETTGIPDAGGHVTTYVLSDELSGAQSANSMTISSAQDSLVCVIGIAEAVSGDDHTIDPDDMSVSTTVQATTISQNHVIDTDDVSVSVSVENTTINQNHIIDPADLSVSASIESTTIAQNHVIDPTDLSVSVGIEGTTISVENDDHVIATDDISVSVSIESTTISQNHVITPADLSVLVSIDSTTITQNHILNPANLSVVVTIEGTTIVLPSGLPASLEASLVQDYTLESLIIL